MSEFGAILRLIAYIVAGANRELLGPAGPTGECSAESLQILERASLQLGPEG